MTRSFVVERAAARHGAALAALFERSGVGCHCRYWHFPGSPNAWLDRVAHHADENRAELLAALDRGSDDATGIVALDAGRVVGWVKVSPVSAVPKLYDQRLYRKLPCFGGARDGVHAIGCFLVDPEMRRQGVARALLDGAIALGRDARATALEAFPRRGDPSSDEAAWTGPHSLFVRAGFTVVNDFAPYPVLRLVLDPGNGGR